MLASCSVVHDPKQREANRLYNLAEDARFEALRREQEQASQSSCKPKSTRSTVGKASARNDA